MDWLGLMDWLELGLGQVRLGFKRSVLCKQRVKKMVLTLKEGAWQMDWSGLMDWLELGLRLGQVRF